MGIHPTAILSEEAVIEEGATLGPYTVVTGLVTIGKGTVIGSHVHIGSNDGEVVIGENNQILPGAVVGGPPQDLKYKGEKTKLVIGNNNTIREFVTINIGTVNGGSVTQIGNDNLFMAYVHLAHDCIFGNNIVVANSTQFSGHVIVEDHAVIGGVCAVNQFTTIGQYAYIAGASVINKDILPFSMAQGRYAVIRATNKIGLERGGFSKEEVNGIHKAIRYLVKGSRTVEEALELISHECEPTPPLKHLVEFVKSSQRGIAR